MPARVSSGLLLLLPAQSWHVEAVAKTHPHHLPPLLLQQVEALRAQQAMLVAQRDAEVAAMEAGLAHNAALIEERDQVGCYERCCHC